MTTIWQARYASRHFLFEAFGETAEAARHALSIGLDQHSCQYPAAPDFKAEVLASCDVQEFELGVAYRDGEQM